MKKELIFRLTILFTILFVLIVGLILQLIRVHGTENYRYTFIVFPTLIILSIYFFIKQHKWAIQAVADTWVSKIIGLKESQNTNNLVSIKEISTIVNYFTNFYTFSIVTFYFLIIVTLDHKLDIKVILVSLGVAFITTVVIQSMYEYGLERKLLSFSNWFYGLTLEGKYYGLSNFFYERKNANSKLFSLLQNKYKKYQKAYVNIPPNENSEIEKKISLAQMYMEDIKNFNERFDDKAANLILKQIPTELKEFSQNYARKEDDDKEFNNKKIKYDSSGPNSVHSSFPKGFNDFNSDSLKTETAQKLKDLNIRHNYYYLDKKIIDAINDL